MVEQILHVHKVAQGNGQMSATHKDSILRSLDLDAALVESLPEAVWSELIGFLEDDHQLVRGSDESDGSPPEALMPALFRSSRLD